MQREDKEALVKLYEDRYAKMGYDVRTLGWRGREDQELRFKVLCDIGDLSDASICDVGCGFGDLVPYLHKRFKGFTYTGIDVSPSLVRKAQEMHPEREFYCMDILKEVFDKRFDYFLLSGALNFRVHDNMRLTTEMVKLMFSSADKGVAVNFLTSYVNHEKPHNFHHSPEMMLTFARTLTKWVALRHDYPLWEFTLYLYREAQS